MNHHYCEKIGSGINSRLLHREIMAVAKKHSLEDATQISITSHNGRNDFICSTGKIQNLVYPEEKYNVVNRAFKDTYIEEVISQYPDYYRWRVLCLDARRTYSIHHDGVIPGKTNYRIHIPVSTNDESFLAFFDHYIENNKKNPVYFAHLSEGNVYQINASKLHTALNFQNWRRIHIVGVTYA